MVHCALDAGDADRVHREAAGHMRSRHGQYSVVIRDLQPDHAADRVKSTMATLYPGVPWRVSWSRNGRHAWVSVASGDAPGLDAIEQALTVRGDPLEVERLDPQSLALRAVHVRPGPSGARHALRRLLSLAAAHG